MSAAVPSDIQSLLPTELATALEHALRTGADAGAEESDEIDGRKLRAERGRSAVLGAALDLVNAGNPAPTIAEIAEASGVSERTIFRYFPDREALFSSLVFEVVPLIAEYLSFERPSGPLADRVKKLVTQRCGFVRVAGPFARCDQFAHGLDHPHRELSRSEGRLGHVDLVAHHCHDIEAEVGCVDTVLAQP